MNVIEINQHIQALEISQDLLRWKMDGWCAWPVIRFNLAALASGLVIETSKTRPTIPERLLQLIGDIPVIFRTKRPQVLLYVASSNRAEVENGRYKDIYFDELLKHIPEYFKIEHINNKLYLERSRSALFPSQMTTSGIYLIASALALVLPPRESAVLATRFMNAVQGVLISPRISHKHIRNFLSAYYWRKRLLRSLLRRLQPQFVLLQTAYSNQALVAAAKELKIKVIEFQHGIIDRHHPGYSWTAEAAPYKEQMQIPDRIYVYGDYWRDELAINGFWNEELRSVGSMRIDHYRLHRSSEADTRIDAGASPTKIVVTTQALEVERLIAFLVEFVRCAQIPLEMDIKLHPREANRQPYLEAFKNHPNVRILLGQEPPSTFELISTADYHASVWSTCHYEALGLGTPTIILPLTNHERVLHLCERAPGYALLAKSPAEMYQIVRQKRRVPPEIASYYFRAGAVQNILDALHQDGLQ